MKDSWDVFWYGIIVEIYMGIRFALTCPEKYPQFNVLFQIVNTMNGLKKNYPVFYCFMEKYQNVLLYGGAIGLVIIFRVCPQAIKQTTNKEER